MQLNSTTVHVYLTSLSSPEAAEPSVFRWLSPDEQARAKQFRFPQHQQHFIAARGFLRKILSHYLNEAPETIVFAYGSHKKPFIPNQPIQFNLAHSGDFALLAVGYEHPLGVDIEMTQAQAKMDIAQRFFSREEITYLQHLSGNEQRDAFYQVWARKEAVVKAIGTGIQQSLASFTVPFDDTPATLRVADETWLLTPLSVDPHYQAALVTHPTVKTVLRCTFDEATHAPVVQK